MSLQPGTRLGPYEITGQIGAGGMGEVYRGTDTNLKRQVAIKVLPESLSSDPERLARFQREAEVLASLNHPHIAQIYGLEKTDGTTALVMELVEGEDLSQRIARGPIPLDEALPIAKQIAEALEAAHEQGIIHRDLKPANIKVRPDGAVKVLDFGLAKLNDPNVSNGPNGPNALSMSPTITSPAMMTGIGVLLGTAAYMSPEQAKGKPANKRSDIWAFGCVLFEMLAGKRAFDGDGVTEVLARVLEREPDWSALPATVPTSIRQLLRRSLVKNPRERVPDIGMARLEIGDVVTSTSTAPSAEAAGTRAVGLPFWRRAAPICATVVVTASVVGLAGWLVVRPSPSHVMRFPIALSGATELMVDQGGDRTLTLAPDGSRIAFVSRRLGVFLQTMDHLDTTYLAGNDQAREPFFSPDGQWVGFFEGPTLKKVAISGGPALTVGPMGGGSRGAAWADDGTIIFASRDPTTGLQRIPDAGGSPTVLTRPDRAKGEGDHYWPEMLPGGRAVMFTVVSSTGQDKDAQIAVLDLGTGKYKTVLRGGSDARYVASGASRAAIALGRPAGYLVYGAAGSLHAVAFDPERLEPKGTPVPVVSEVLTTKDGAANFAVVRDGTLAYASGTVEAAVARTLVWVDRQGHEEALKAPPRGYAVPRISPDGSRVAISVRDQQNDLWIWDLARETLTRTTFDPQDDDFPVWTVDGRGLLFSSRRGSPTNVSGSLYSQAADGTGEAERIASGSDGRPCAVSPDSTRVVLSKDGALATLDLSTGELQTFKRVPGFNCGLSSDGRWLVYESSESGRAEIYVRPFPSVDGGRWQVSTNGGSRPVWARNGQELFYLSPDGALMSVRVIPAPIFETAPPTVVFKTGYAATDVTQARTYDVSPDGRRFLMIKQEASAAQIVVALNWLEELKRLVSTK